MESAAITKSLLLWGLRLLKAVFFILLSIAVGRLLGKPEDWINDGIADKVACFLYGDVNIESLYDTWFYLSVISVLSMTTLLYIFITMLVKTIKR
ncbi:hypothetical protein ACMGGS_09985 [Superficieibacter sp. BNK-5]|uniref:hypothetical protein n=1 Tax=Superficieibacter sp. BNK-5 TaxID=3376142 RepID=UPI0039BFFB12